MTYRKVYNCYGLKSERKMTPWHMPSYIWVDFCPCWPIFPVQNRFIHIFPASAWSPFLTVILTVKLARLLQPEVHLSEPLGHVL